MLTLFVPVQDEEIGQWTADKMERLSSALGGHQCSKNDNKQLQCCYHSVMHPKLAPLGRRQKKSSRDRSARWSGEAPSAATTTWSN